MEELLALFPDSSPDLLNRQRRGAEQDLDLSTKQVAHYSAAAAIRHVNHLDPGQHLEELAGYMAGSSDAGRPETDLARIGLGVRRELRNRFGRNRWIYHHHEWQADDARDGRDVANKNEIELVVERGIDRV